jgi:hypothetical protein
MHKSVSFRILFLIFLGFGCSLTNVFAQGTGKPGMNQRWGYILDWKGDTIKGIYMLGLAGCGLGKEVKFLLKDSTNNYQEYLFTPNTVSGFGFENKHYRSAGYYKSVRVLTIPPIYTEQEERIFVKVYYDGSRTLVSYTFYETNPAALVLFGISALAFGCQEVGFINMAKGNEYITYPSFRSM